MTTNDIDAIRDRASKATPGPWAWHGNERNHDVYLTQEYGQTVMKFRRWGMQNAQPVFTVNHFLKPASEFLQADHNGVIWSIHHPDAAFIAAARQDVPALCDEVEALRGELARARKVIGWVYAWSQAYPLDVFPEPDKQRAKELLEAGGLTLDAVSASAIRHAVGSIGRDAADFLRDAGLGEGE